MSKMTLGVKIATGFGLILLIAIILGVVGVVNMNSATANADKMDNAYVPEVEIANGLERNFLKMRMSMVAYIYTEKEKSISDAKEYYAKVDGRLQDAKDLLKENPWLKVLEEKIKVADTLSEHYYQDSLKLEEVYRQKAQEWERLNISAKAYVKATQDFAEGQNAAMERDINNLLSSEQLKERLNKIAWVNELIKMGTDLRIANFKSALARDTADLEKVIKTFEAAFEPKLDQLKTITRLQVDLNRIDETRKAGLDYIKSLKALLRIEQEVARFHASLAKTGVSALQAAEDTARAGVGGTKKLAKESNEALNAASNIMITGLIAAVILGLILAFFIIRSITRPVTEAVKIIADANSQVVSASTQISSSAQSLAEGASEQASSVEEVSATVEQSTAINNQNAENAREADSLARDANHAAQSGNDKVKHLMTAMEKITDSSERIAKIIKTIDEIAFQTNLLALNAAVEAARAGEHGLGFAVVADEVKNLAQRSADAAKETAGIIEEAIDEIKTGNQIAKDTDTAFSEILDKAEKTSGLISEIAVSIKEQADGMNQVASAMGQIDQVTQTNAATSEEAAAAAEELNAQANSMMDNVRNIAKIVGFQIESGGEGAYSPKRSSAPVSQVSRTPVKPPVKKVAHKAGKSDIFPLDEDDLKEF